MPAVLFFLLILFTGKAWSDPTMHLITNHDQLNAKDFQVKGVELVQDKPQTQSQQIERGVREKFIESAGLKKQTALWDEFDKDILLLRVEHLSPEKLIEQYPDLSSVSLQKLKTLILKHRKNVKAK
jgi:hypothetical protein